MNRRRKQHEQLERDTVQLPLQRYLERNGIKVGYEVDSNYGRIDLLTDTEIIECKHVLDKRTNDKAIGQLTRYNLAFPGRKRAIATGEIRDKATVSYLQELGIGLYLVTDKEVTIVLSNSATVGTLNETYPIDLEPIPHAEAMRRIEQARAEGYRAGQAELLDDYGASNAEEYAEILVEEWCKDNGARDIEDYIQQQIEERTEHLEDIQYATKKENERWLQEGWKQGIERGRYEGKTQAESASHQTIQRLIRDKQTLQLANDRIDP